MLAFGGRGKSSHRLDGLRNCCACVCSKISAKAEANLSATRPLCSRSQTTAQGTLLKPSQLSGGGTLAMTLDATQATLAYSLQLFHNRAWLHSIQPRKAKANLCSGQNKQHSHISNTSLAQHSVVIDSTHTTRQQTACAIFRPFSSIHNHASSATVLGRRPPSTD